MSSKKYASLINGNIVDGDQFFDVINPSSNQVLATVTEVDSHGIEAALSSAKEGFKVWSKEKPSVRKEKILKYVEILEREKEGLISLLISETGKPRDNAEYDFGMLITCLKFFVEEYERMDQPVIQDPSGRFLNYIQRQPLGVVVGLLAWNFPLLNVGYKLGPVLAAGCSAIIKPSEFTPLASLEVGYLAKEAGIPDGVVNMIACKDKEVFKPALESEIPAMVTMIGSTRGGLSVMQSSCSSIKQFSVELGGNAPVLVYPDADLAKAAEKIVGLKFANTGQVCVSPNRCYVHDSILEEFTEKVLEITSSVEMGPMISSQERDNVLAMIDLAVKEGATIAAGGSAKEGPGFFMQPTVLTGMTHGQTMCRKEIFGPVLPIYSFSDDEDEIALANDVSEGLAAYVFTSNLSKALKAAQEIEAGSVCINEPHYSVELPHGGLKQSGVGKDCSRYSLEEYLTVKRVSVLIES
jgi:acyl-CoA reductase-like NAD-dependent aldehyde dehydrogenase